MCQRANDSSWLYRANSSSIPIVDVHGPDLAQSQSTKRIQRPRYIPLQLHVHSASRNVYLHIYESRQPRKVSCSEAVPKLRDSGSKRAQRQSHVPLCVATKQRVQACTFRFEAIGHGVVSSSGVVPDFQESSKGWREQSVHIRILPSRYSKASYAGG